MQSRSPPKHALNTTTILFLLFCFKSGYCSYSCKRSALRDLLRTLPVRSEILEPPLFLTSVWGGAALKNAHVLNSDHHYNEHSTETAMKQIHRFGRQCTKTSKLRMVTDSRHCNSRCSTLSPELKSRHYGFFLLLLLKWPWISSD